MSFAIITDSTSDISPARAQELGIYVIELCQDFGQNSPSLF